MDRVLHPTPHITSDFQDNHSRQSLALILTTKINSNKIEQNNTKN